MNVFQGFKPSGLEKIANAMGFQGEEKDFQKFLEENPDFEKYGWNTNMCYGTEKHMKAVEEFGPTPYHRKSFNLTRH